MSSKDAQLTLLNYIGTMLYGFCGGAFGDIYEDKKIVGIGPRWIVCEVRLLVNDCKEQVDTFVLADFENSQELVEFIEEYKKEESWD